MSASPDRFHDSTLNGAAFFRVESPSTPAGTGWTGMHLDLWSASICRKHDSGPFGVVNTSSSPLRIGASFETNGSRVAASWATADASTFWTKARTVSDNGTTGTWRVGFRRKLAGFIKPRSPNKGCGGATESKLTGWPASANTLAINGPALAGSK